MRGVRARLGERARAAQLLPAPKPGITSHRSMGWGGGVPGLGAGAWSTLAAPRGIRGPIETLLSHGLSVSLSLSPRLSSAQGAKAYPASQGWTGLITGKCRGRSKGSPLSRGLGAQNLAGGGMRVGSRWKERPRERERKVEIPGDVSPGPREACAPGGGSGLGAGPPPG